MWTPGETVVLRGVVNNRPWYVQTCLVVHDTPVETALLLLPGAECAAPGGYIHGKHGPSHQWDRWTEALNNTWTLETYRWHTNRFLFLLEPGKYYASIYIWEHTTNAFQCYYINFQQPFKRFAAGLDALDLELDIVIDPDYRWRIKDQAEYERGIQLGIISGEEKRQVESAQDEIIQKIKDAAYPLNGAWLNWRPNPAWQPPKLPAHWQEL